MNMHDSWCIASKEEDAKAKTQASCVELGSNETKPGQGHGILRA